MPGSDDRKPSDLDRPPVSRVGDELQEQEDAGNTDVAEAERDAMKNAKDKGWDQAQTAREGS